ncbi:MFS transporter [Phenylobacterium sp. J367]|uniref:MFS transporter n=1 Tax=Phenylobacterium sp. J367 TaxID=2898435 RepID=UPI002151B8BD|nr:MFS transporter [Phenylobacterium sp. J367]MCR5878643.1 MFS transporter [Phenylobacterium sp. J367]
MDLTATETGAEALAPEGATAPGLTAGQRLKAILGGSAGNLVEWYDWFVYSFFAVYFTGHFFPGDDDLASLLKTMAVFAVGFFARPVGAWLMGLYADRAGRRTALTVAVSMMCAGSLIIAILPSYETIGVAAPILLVLARILQGLSVGGEYGASATYLSEMAGKRRRGFWSSFQFVTMVMGQLVALGILSLLQTTLTDAQLESWGWRIPFFIGAAMAVVVFWIRARMDESQSFEASKARGEERARTMMLFLRYPKETVQIFLFTAGGSLAFYSYTTYMPKFLVGTAGIAETVATAISAASLVVYLLALPLFGWISDHTGRKFTLAIAFGGCALLSYPALATLAGGPPPVVAFLIVSALVFLLSGYNAVSAVVKAELFPANVRALGVALPYGMATASFGGTAEMAALAFKRAGNESGFYVYVAAGMLVSFLVVFTLRDNRRHSLILED